MLKRKNTFIILIILLFTAMGSVATAQKPGKQKSVKKQRKEFLTLQEERAAELKVKMDADRKEHVENQTKNTRKRMKKNKKKTRRLRKGKTDKSFFDRLFTKKPR